MKTKRFRSGQGTLEGKWFWEQEESAVKWGEKTYPKGDYKIVEVKVPKKVADKYFKAKNLDQIGNARYAELPQINRPGVSIRPSKRSP